MYVFISDMHRLTTMLALVVVIVVHYYSSVQNSLLKTNQDFHTQMWQEKCDLGFNRGPVLNVSRVSRASCSSDKKTFEISILTIFAHFLFSCSLISNEELPQWMESTRVPLGVLLGGAHLECTNFMQNHCFVESTNSS